MVESQVSQFLQDFDFYNKRICVAVSGGADSVALFFVLHHISTQFRLSLSIAHINYQLRGNESEQECNYVHSIAEQYTIPIFSKNVPLDPNQSGMEDRARKIRHDFFRELIDESVVDYVALGHTLEDQAETALFRLLRGTSIHGVSGMEPVREDGIIRPMLRCKREMGRGFLRRNKIVWYEDSSNQSNDYKRNLIRNEIFPLLHEINSSAVDHIAGFSNHCGTISKELIQAGMAILKSYHFHSNEQLFHFDASVEMVQEVVHAIAEQLRKRGVPLSEKQIDLITTAGERKGKVTLLPRKWRIYRSFSKLIFHSSDISPFSDDGDDFVGDNVLIRHGLYSIPENLLSEIVSVRIVEQADSLEISGKDRNIKAYLKKKGVPSLERARFPVIVLKDGNLTLPLI